ncbi:enolase C-terminal domain-like protein, partial [Sporosarcina gallistercoris]|uniref:mandelate racemase/muconate lactonizing enzyme family protein n=1 Tax=Sporosarcina gallistercoris TaxID=2762245 RepID=UPI003D281A77
FSTCQIQEMAKEAKLAVEEGYRILKLKVGIDKKLDIERIQSVRQAVGFDISIKVDANQGWETSADSMYVLDRIKACEIDWIEQPVLASDIDGLKEIKQKATVPVMIDEGLHGKQEMNEITVKRAVDMINIKLMKCGGLYPATQLVHQAELAGYTCQIGSMVESAIASAAGLHISIAKKRIKSNELVGPLMFSKDVATLDIQVPFVHLKETPGLGIDVDESILEELTSHYVKIC